MHGVRGMLCRLGPADLTWQAPLRQGNRSERRHHVNSQAQQGMASRRHQRPEQQRPRGPPASPADNRLTGARQQRGRSHQHAAGRSHQAAVGGEAGDGAGQRCLLRLARLG